MKTTIDEEFENWRTKMEKEKRSYINKICEKGKEKWVEG